VVLRWRVFHTAGSVVCTSDDGGFFHLFNEKKENIFAHILSACLLDFTNLSERTSGNHVLFSCSAPVRADGKCSLYRGEKKDTSINNKTCRW